MNSFKIYKLIFPNDKVYIGQTRRSINQRLNEHNKDKRKKTILRNAIEKYGFNNIKVKIIKQSLSLKQANKLEKNLIIKTKDFNYNMAEGGGHNRYRDEDYRLKLSLSQKGKPRWSKQDKKRISKQLTGRTVSLETRKLKSKMFSKWWLIETPNNEKIKVLNLYEYCKKNKLDVGTMSRVAKGVFNQHKGYKVVKLT